MSISNIKIDAKNVVVVDCSNMKEKSEIIDKLEQGSIEIAKYAENSVYLITNVTKTKYDGDISKAFQSYASRNTPYIKTSVLVGVEGMQKAILFAVKALTKREFILVNSMEDAQKIISEM